MANQIPNAKADHAEKKKPTAKSQKRAASEREFGVALTLLEFDVFLAKVSNHSLPLGPAEYPAGSSDTGLTN
jgi:hypothetical protein